MLVCSSGSSPWLLVLALHKVLVDIVQVLCQFAEGVSQGLDTDGIGAGGGGGGGVVREVHQVGSLARCEALQDLFFQCWDNLVEAGWY